MRHILVTLVVALVVSPVSAAHFGECSTVGPNFTVHGDPISYTITVRSVSSTAPSASIVDQLPLGVEFIPGSLSCSGGAGGCAYDEPSRTVSWNGSITVSDTVVVSFSVTTETLPDPGYVTNEVVADDPGFDALLMSRTTCVHRSGEQAVLGPIFPISNHGSGWYQGWANGVYWNSVSETYVAAWIRSDYPTNSNYEVQAVTVDPEGAVGVVQHVSTGQVDEQPSVACSEVSGNCLVAWSRREPAPSINSDVYARLLGSGAAPLGSEFAIYQGSGHQGNPDVAYNSALDEFLVTYENRWASGLRDVVAQRVRASDGALLTWANVATGSDGGRTSLRAAHLAGRDQYLLVYNFAPTAGDPEIRAKIAPGHLGGVSPAPEMTIASTLTSYESPAVAAIDDDYLVVWSHLDVSNVGGIRARRVSGDGSPQGPAGGFRVSEFEHNVVAYSVPLVEFAGQQGFLVGWDHDDAATPTQEDLHGRFVEPGMDHASFTEFPTWATIDWDFFGHFACSRTGQCLSLRDGMTGIDGRFVWAWLVFAHGFDEGTFEGWSQVVGATP
ncbi:MAG: hypothetical protein P8127_07475 [Acidobacteriota bacterium]